VDGQDVAAILRRYMEVRGTTPKKLAQDLDEDPLVLEIALRPRTTYMAVLDMICGGLGLKIDFVPVAGDEESMMRIQAARMPFSDEINRTMAVELAEQAIRYLRHNAPPATMGAATMLSDTDIDRAIRDRRLVVDPYHRELLQPASLDVRIGTTFVPYKAAVHNRPQARVHLFKPGQFCLGVTDERIVLPHDMAAQVSGKSTWERHGLFVVPGFIAPGFNGVITLAIKNLSEKEIGVPHGVPIAQVSFTQLTSRVTRYYGHPELRSHYQAQSRAAPPAY
jgi:dCTP deaminase